MRGFVNDDTMCYFNSAIQCLFNIPILTNHFLRDPYKDGKCMFTVIYQVLLKQYWTADKTPLNLDGLHFAFRKEFPRFGSDEQHDVQETVLCIIDILERSQPIIKDWFYGKKVQETIWPGGKTVNEEDFSIHLMTYKGDSDMSKMIKDSTDWNVLENFQDTDGITYNAATTRMLFSKLPPILMISFDTKSCIQMIQDMSLDGHQYKLIACVLHVGNQRGGHYVSYIRRKSNWYLINDEHVKETPPPPEGSYYLMVYSS
jgi:ubiquitin C-terminal hydrolase